MTPLEPRLLRFSEVPRWVWGDDVSHRVSDWGYSVTERMNFIAFSLSPGGYWRHSQNFKPSYPAHEGYYVVQGELTVHNPQTGEVQIVRTGEALHFRENTWHYGYNFTTKETLVIEALAPVPTGISPDELERLAEPITDIHNHRAALMGNWPWNAAEARVTQTLVPLRETDWLHILRGTEPPVRVSLFVATDKLTMGRFSLLPGVMAEAEAHPGEEAFIVLEGRVNLHLPESDDWFELNERDGFYLPPGVRHQYCNRSDRPALVVFAVAPP
ncbi:MAG: cupin domain-containing protein [Anaerolineales bacterium]